MQSERRYVVLPATGFQSDGLAKATKLRTIGLVPISPNDGRSSDSATQMRVLDSMHEDGPKLIEMSPQAELNLRVEFPELRFIPVVKYKKMWMRPAIERSVRPQIAATTVNSQVKISVLSRKSNNPISNAHVVAFTNYGTREGAEGFTDDNGKLLLAVKSGTKIDRFYVFGPSGYWSFLVRSVALENQQEFSLLPIDLEAKGSYLENLYGNLPKDAGNHVTVAVVDSGVAANHPGLPVAGGANLVFDETSDDINAMTEWGPAKKEGEHGTHVAGIIGARPTGKAPFRGVAPGVSLRSYRVFPNSGEGADNYDVMNAIDRAVMDGCHIINLSLGGGSEDDGIRAAIQKAVERGTLVVAAAGNDYRKTVSFPAFFESCIAVSAMGRRGSFPADAAEVADVAKPYGASDPDSFVAAFSNYGPQISVTGPGVGVISTLPENGYGAMSGTSMACPAVAGYAAHLLSANPSILQMRGSDRTKALREALYKSAKELGFGRDYEGFGLPGYGAPMRTEAPAVVAAGARPPRKRRRA
jgi:subtilisin